MKCITPYMVRDQKHIGVTIPVPCGKCPFCVKRRISEWSFRLMQQEKVSVNALFVTLTYDYKHAPITENRFLTLDKIDIQKYIKRLRKEQAKVSKEKITYYVVGEYGTENYRPHYHMIIFNANADLMFKTWQKGYIHFGFVTEASIGYSLKYMFKRGRIPLHSNDDRQPEFALMSKGIGINYISPHMYWWHKEDLENRMYLTLKNGRKVSMPRYYKEKIYDEQERQIVAFFQKKRILEEENKALEEGGEMYYRDLAEMHKAAFVRMEILLLKGQKL